MDSDRLRDWVSDARRLLAEGDRLSVGDDEIGQALVAAPADDEGWPCRAVRDLLEELKNDRVDAGFARRVFNNRGGTMRSLDAGARRSGSSSASIGHRQPKCDRAGDGLPGSSTAWLTPTRLTLAERMRQRSVAVEASIRAVINECPGTRHRRIPNAKARVVWTRSPTSFDALPVMTTTGPTVTEDYVLGELPRPPGCQPQLHAKTQFGRLVCGRL